MELVHKLNLNKHPKDNDNLSLVNALNIKISTDGSCLSNEESIEEISVIKEAIKDWCSNNFNFTLTYNNIIKIIPTTKDLILLVNVVEIPQSAFIFIYNVENQTCINIGGNAYESETNIEYVGLEYNGGDIKGTYTYNINGDLILAIAESNVPNKDIPLKVINLGKADGTKYEDLNQKDSKLAINPELKIPEVTNLSYIKGNAYKGWYYLFYRHQINNYNKTYTQWYPLGFPIYVDTINKNGIIKYIFKRDNLIDVNIFDSTTTDIISGDKLNFLDIITPKDGKQGFCVGCTDNFSNNTDIAYESFKVDLNIPSDVMYYQIGIVCVSKTYTKAFQTVNINSSTTQSFTFDINLLNEANVDDFIIDNYNPFNIKNLINYKNRLYIANYDEHPANDDNIDKNIINDIKIKLSQKYFTEESLVYDVALLNNKDDNMISNQYTSHSDHQIPLTSYMGVKDDQRVIIKDIDSNKVYQDYANKFVISTANYKIQDYAVILHFKEDGGADIINNAEIIKVGAENSPLYFNKNNTGINGGHLYVNTKLDFNKRKINDTLIPGEVYNFFIHFVDKYGQASNGYKLENPIKWKIAYQDYEVLPFKFNDVYGAIPIEENVIRYDTNLNKYVLNIENIKFFSNIDFNNHILTNEVNTINVTNGNIQTFSDLIEYTNFDFEVGGINENGETYYTDSYFRTNYLEYGRVFNSHDKYPFKIAIYDKNYIFVGFWDNINQTINKNDVLLYTECILPEEFNDMYYYRITGKTSDDSNIDTTILKDYFTIYYEPKSEEDTEDDNNIKDEIISISNFSDYECYLDEKYIDLKWFQIIESIDLNNFNTFINSKNERLFKVPLRSTHNVIYKNNKSIIKNITNKINISNVTIPEGYIGYFISYEKYEPIRRFSGMLTRADFISQSTVVDFNNIIDVANKKKSNTMMFYSGQLDIVDSIKSDFNILRIEGDRFNYYDIPNWDYYQRADGYDYCYDMNKPFTGPLYENGVKNYAMPNYTIVAGGSGLNNRIGLGTGIQLEDSYNLFPEVIGNGAESNTAIRQFYVTLLNNTRNIYMSDDKTLIPISQVIYDVNEHIIEHGYNGHWTYDGVIVYENSGVLFNEATKIVTRISDNSEYFKSELPLDKPHTYQNDIPFLAYVQFPVCDITFYESKRFKNEPDNITFITYIDDEETENSRYARGIMVTPQNSIDLFENTQINKDLFYPKKYSNFADWKSSMRTFDKTIRRSNIIQDESTYNSWKKFPIEAYKIINENKGKITNIVGAGHMFLVHTEHSLFMFDTNNMIKALNTDLQITQPDAFDVEYKEIFTSTLGYGGLQDKNAWILDQFGYIFYNNDSNNFYRFDNNTITLIDKDIINWLNKYKPYNVRFANDKFNNRLLIKMNYNIDNEIKNIVLSYNYAINSFISLHSYYFEEGINTKNNLYLKCNTIHEGCGLHQFINDDSSFGEFDNIIDNIGTKTIKPSKISIIVNPQYLTIKMLEHITYKFTKLANSVNVDNTTLPVEGEKQPFSGNTIRIYNNLVDTGELDITVDNEVIKNIFCDYTKPYWHLGNWNFNYLMNNVKNHKMEAFTDNYSRLYGNYFIIEFTFNNIDKLKVEFEELDYKLIKD